MAASKGKIRLLSNSRIIVKILLLLILYLAMLCVPLLAKDIVTTAFSGFNENSPYDVTGVPALVYNSLYTGFLIFTGALFAVNLLFRLIDERLNDTVTGRKAIQITLNILIILGGALYLLYLTYIQIPLNGWWVYSDLYQANDSSNVLYWGGAVLFLICASLLSVLDIRVLAPESRKPYYRKNKLNRQA